MEIHINILQKLVARLHGYRNVKYENFEFFNVHLSYQYSNFVLKLLGL